MPAQSDVCLKPNAKWQLSIRRSKSARADNFITCSMFYHMY